MSLNLPSRPFRYLVLALIPLVAGACGDELVDADFGGVDLAPFFFDSGPTLTTGGGPPKTVEVQEGWLDGVATFYYDFGWSAASKDFADPETRARLGLGERARIPKLALVNPMYFFFDSRGNPMFTPPQYETKTGYFFMVGGKDLRALNPDSNASRSVAYPIRERSLLTDPNRNVADYQRPIIDVVYDRERPELLQKYSGLWEVVKVIAPAGYTPDAIKGWDTLEKGWNRGSGEFKLEPTEAVINCPLVDSRTLVIPSIAAFEEGQLRDPQPRIELWYRQKRVFCFMVNGWPALGRTQEGADGVDKYILYKASEDSARFSVMDTDVFRAGREGTAAERRDVVAPLGTLYMPTITSRQHQNFIAGNTVTTGSLPKRNKNDLPGYRPIRWWWNIQISEMGRDFFDNRYFKAAGTGLNDIRGVDSSRLSPRYGGRNNNEVYILNFPVVAQTVKCPNTTSAEDDTCRKIGQVCATLQGETNQNCVVRQVRYAEFCAPTVAECRQKPQQATPSAPKDTIEQWFRVGGQLGESADAVPQEWQMAQTDARKNGKEIIIWGSGMYSCLEEGVSRLGHCYLACNGDTANSLQGKVWPPEGEEALKLNLKSGRQIEKRFALDSRCGGALMPGYRCLPVTDVPTDRGGSICLRDCQTGEGEDVTDAVCQVPTPTYFSDSLVGKDASEDTRCLPTVIPGQSLSFTACRKNEAFAPY